MQHTCDIQDTLCSIPVTCRREWSFLKGKSKVEAQSLFVEAVAALRKKHGDGDGMARVIAMTDLGGKGYSLYSKDLDLHVISIRGTDALTFEDVIQDVKLWVESVAVAIMTTLQPLTLGTLLVFHYFTDVIH